MLKKSILIFFGLSLMFLSSCGSNNPLGTSETFNLKSLTITKISSTNKVTVSANLKWNTVSNSAYYELSRIKNNGTEVPIGNSKINKDLTSFNDTNLEEFASYKYIIRAIDSNNKLIKKEETQLIKPINSSELKAVRINNLIPQPAVNPINRESNLSWTSVEDANLYYPSIENDSNNKKVFGIFTKNTKFSINDSNSPVVPEDIITQELPILTGGMEKAVRHKFSVFTIKFNNTDTKKATAIGIRESDVFYIIL